MTMEYCDLPGCPGAPDDEPCSRCDPPSRVAREADVGFLSRVVPVPGEDPDFDRWLNAR